MEFYQSDSTDRKCAMFVWLNEDTSHRLDKYIVETRQKKYKVVNDIIKSFLDKEGVDTVIQSV